MWSLATIEPVERLERQGLRQLASAIGTEVHVHHRVAVANARGVIHDRRLDELVVLPPLVRGLDGVERRRGAEPLATHECVPRQLGSLPTTVPVHRVVAAGDSTDARLASGPRLEFAEVATGRPGWRVPAVGEGVQDHAIARQAEPVSKRHEGLDVVVRRVDASGPDEAEDVQARPMIQGVGARSPQGRVVIEGSVLDRLGDARQVLEHAEAGSEVQVAHL